MDKVISEYLVEFSKLENMVQKVDGILGFSDPNI